MYFSKVIAPVFLGPCALGTKAAHSGDQRFSLSLSLSLSLSHRALHRSRDFIGTQRALGGPHYNLGKGPYFFTSKIGPKIIINFGPQIWGVGWVGFHEFHHISLNPTNRIHLGLTHSGIYFQPHSLTQGSTFSAATSKFFKFSPLLIKTNFQI